MPTATTWPLARATSQTTRASSSSHNAVWSRSVIGSIRVGYNRIDWDEIVPPQDLRGIGIPGVDTSNPGFSQIAITGYRTLGSVERAQCRRFEESSGLRRHIADEGNAHDQDGRPALSTGNRLPQLATQQRHFQLQRPVPRAIRLRITFLGYGSSASLSKYAKLNFPHALYPLLRAGRLANSERLTLNLGLRYELITIQVDQNNAIANFDLDTDPLNPRIVLAGSGS